MEPDRQVDTRMSKLRAARIDEVRSVLLPIEEATQVSGWSEKLYVREFETSFSHISIIEEEGAPAGFIVFWIVADELHILNVAVHPSFQRRGLGRDLVMHAIEAATHARAGFATLEVRHHNLPAIRLYEGLGFKEIAYRKAYYADNGDDARILGLLLDLPAQVTND